MDSWRRTPVLNMVMVVNAQVLAGSKIGNGRQTHPLNEFGCGQEECISLAQVVVWTRWSLICPV